MHGSTKSHNKSHGSNVRISSITQGVWNAVKVKSMHLLPN